MVGDCCPEMIGVEVILLDRAYHPKLHTVVAGDRWMLGFNVPDEFYLQGAPDVPFIFTGRRDAKERPIFQERVR